MAISLDEFSEALRADLPALLEKTRCPGVSIGVLLADQMSLLAAGVADIATKAAVTEQTAFQIGSNTKLLTATLAMQLVEQGLLGLDDPVVQHVPGFRLAVEGAAELVTIRHLLTHSSGIDGDFEGTPGHGFSDSMVADYVSAMAEVGLVHEPGSGFSYCNAGWVLLGRVIELARHAPYHQVLRDHLAGPLGTKHLGMAPADLASWPLAHGTLLDATSGEATQAPVYVTAPACAPAGSSPVATAEDMLRFLRCHLSDGSPLLSGASVEAMQQRQLDVPPLGMTDGWGLGWMVGSTADGQRVIAHGGGTLGQLSHLQVLPDRGLALVVLTNGLGGGALGLELIARTFRQLADATVRSAPAPPATPVALDLERYAGRYERIGTTVTVVAGHDALLAEVVQTSPVPDVDVIPPMSVRLLPVDNEVFLIEGTEGVIRFLGDDGTGRPSHIFNSRRIPRVA